MLTANQVLDHLNQAWAHGTPNRDIRRAGVLVHVLDNTEAVGTPWLPCLQHDWCGRFGDRISASIVNALQPTLFTQATAGIVLAPQAPIHCSYPTDGGSMSKLCPSGTEAYGCVPGCSSKDGTGRPAWCSHETAWNMGGTAQIWDCAFRPEDLEAMLLHHRNERSLQYNEVIVNTASWERNLPDMVMAVFWLRTPWLTSGQRWGGEQQARGVHSAFLERFPGATTPLVSLDTSLRNEGAFEMAR